MSTSPRKILSRGEYNSIASFIAVCPPRKALELLKTKFPTINDMTLWSINNLAYQEKMKRKTILLKQKTQFLQRIYEPFWHAANKGDREALLKIADSVDVSPSLVAKSVLEEYYTRTGIPQTPEKPKKERAVSSINMDKSPVQLLHEYMAINRVTCSWDVRTDGLFVAHLVLGNNKPVCGRAESKKLAQHRAAMLALEQIADIMDSKMAEQYAKYTSQWKTLYSEEDKENSEKLKTETAKCFEIIDEESTAGNLSFPSKKMISKWMKEPYEIPDRTLCQQVAICNANDCEFGPIGLAITRSIGNEYEYKLKQKLRQHNLPFKDENELRSKGFDKTPDIKLETPIAVDGKVVNWIESKAMFADDSRHARYLNEQLWSYWNRFGPGMVIYWFGFLDDIEDNSSKGILVKHDFPDHIITMEALSSPI